MVLWIFQNIQYHTGNLHTRDWHLRHKPVRHFNQMMDQTEILMGHSVKRELAYVFLMKYMAAKRYLIQHNRIGAKISKIMGILYYILVHGTEKDGMREVDVLENDFDISRYTPISQCLMIRIYTERYRKSDYKSIHFISETIVSA